MIRPPAVAGTFYPADGDSLREILREFTAEELSRQRALGVVVPHAGYVYSGHVAGAVYAGLQLPTRYIILCPNHTGRGSPLAILSRGEWTTPLGQVPVDDELATRLMGLDSDLDDDFEAHRMEHALEVQLPFLQYLVGPKVRFVPIVIGTSDFEPLKRLGEAMANVVGDSSDDVLIVASSDMNHYEPEELTRVKDRKAIDRMLQLDAEGLYRTVFQDGVSMCGFGGATSMLIAAKVLGASEAKLVRYTTSGDIAGDWSRVVGYAGIVVS